MRALNRRPKMKLVSPGKYVGSPRVTDNAQLPSLPARLGELLGGIDKSKSYTGFSERNPVLPQGIDKRLLNPASDATCNGKGAGGKCSHC